MISCSIAYYDGTDLLTVRGDVPGTIIAGKGGHGFGFDPTFIPDGHTLSYAEMPAEEKDKVSHRSVAIRLLVDELRKR